MRKIVVGCAIAATLGFVGSAAAAPSANTGAMASHSAMSSSHMASSAGHKAETKMDIMMVNNCLKMPHDKMVKDPECQDYMKHHPDWMKHK